MVKEIFHRVTFIYSVVDKLNQINLFIIAILLSTIFTACNEESSSREKQTVITIIPSITYQTITGWEASGTIGQGDFPGQFHKWKDTVVDLAVNDLGINRIRLRVNSGIENPVDYFTPYMNGKTTRKKWKEHWYEIINDNDDPYKIDMRGFQFSVLDHSIDNLVIPLKQRLEARGEKLYINLLEVDFICCQSSSNLEHKESPEEYAEFILAAYQHMQNKYGFVPDAVEVILEPDNAGWSGKQIGRNIVSAAKRLKAHGFKPAFIAPSNTNMKKAIKYFDDMIRVPGVLQYLEEFSYHRYSGVSDKNLDAIASRAVKYGINTAMLEHIGSGYEALHKDIKKGRNSAWQQFTLAYPTKDNGAQYYTIEISDVNNPQVKIAARTKFLRQYFKFIRSGAVRLEATSSADDFDPLAFINIDGTYVVVIKAESGGSFYIKGLPAGTYGIKYTTSRQYDVDKPDVMISPGQTLNAGIPMKGVITVYAKSSVESSLSTVQPKSHM